MKRFLNAFMLVVFMLGFFQQANAGAGLGLGFGYGLGISKGRSATIPLVATEHNFTSALPSNWEYTRADTVATYRNSSGELTLGTSNGPRFDHTSGGTALGLLIEGTRVNRCTNNNLAISATTNISVTGDATITTTSDSAAVTAFKAGSVVTSSVFEASGGAGGGTVVITCDTGATGAFSASLVARVTAGTSASFGITPNATATSISGAAYARFKANNLTATASTDDLVITLPASTTIRFFGNQVEAGPFASSIIRTAGAIGTRASDRLRDVSVKTRGYWTGATSQGGIVVDFDTYDIGNHGAMFAYLSDNNDGTSGNINSLGTRMLSGRAKTDSQYNYYGPATPTNPFGSTDLLTLDKAGEGDLALLSAGFSWKQNGDVLHLVNGNFRRGTLGTFTTEPDRLYIGNAVFTQHLFGHVKKVNIFNRLVTMAEVGPYMVKPTWRCGMASGQSNMDGGWSNSLGATNGGEQIAVSTMDSFWPSTRNCMINGSTSGTAVVNTGNGMATAWLDTDLVTLGTPFNRWLEIESGVPDGVIEFMADKAGESDAGNRTRAEYKAAQLKKFELMQAALGHTDEEDYVPVMLINIGRELSANQAGYQTIAEANMELAYEKDWISLIETMDVSVSGSIHIDDPGQQVMSRRYVRKAMSVLGEVVSGGVDGPVVANVSGTGATIDIDLDHDTGATDFTPTSSIAGFHFFDNNTEIPVTAAVQLDDDTIRLTLNSTPSNANRTLYYGYRSLFPDTAANLVKDNGAETLPLRRAVWSSTNSGTTWTDLYPPDVAP